MTTPDGQLRGICPVTWEAKLRPTWRGAAWAYGSLNSARRLDSEHGLNFQLRPEQPLKITQIYRVHGQLPGVSHCNTFSGDMLFSDEAVPAVTPLLIEFSAPIWRATGGGGSGCLETRNRAPGMCKMGFLPLLDQGGLERNLSRAALSARPFAQWWDQPRGKASTFYRGWTRAEIRTAFGSPTSRGRWRSSMHWNTGHIKGRWPSSVPLRFGGPGGLGGRAPSALIRLCLSRYASPAHPLPYTWAMTSSTSSAPVYRHGEIQVSMLSTGPVQENAVLAWGPEMQGFLIDPGDDAERVLAWTHALGVQVQAILLTHAHFDHIGAVQPVREALKVPVYLHPDGLPLYAQGAASAARWNIPFIQPSEPEHEITAGQTFTAGSLTLVARDLPGHAPGHVVFVANAPGQEPFAVVGDTLFAGSVGRTDLPGGSHELLLKGIGRELMSLPSETAIYPGHGGPSTIGHERRGNPFLK